MGNNSVKKHAEDPCEKNVEELFATISKNKGRILRSDLKKIWASQIDEELYEHIENYLFLENQTELSYQTFKKFFSDISKGDCDKKTEILSKMLEYKDEVSGINLLKFISSILKSILIIQENKVPKKFNSWNNRITEKDRNESLKEYGTYFLSQIKKCPDDQISKNDLRSLLNCFDFFLHMVVSRLYDTEEKDFYTHLLPKWKYGPVDSGKTLEELSELNMFQIMFLNLGLPVDFRNEWRILFSTSIHGESFSRLSAEIVNKGPTIILVKDKEDHLFGGFAPSNWSLGPTFCGDSRSFLFTLYPRMNMFMSTNFNENYQYMNVGQQTMPNGLGMGGRLDYFGLWLDAEFGSGYCSESCTTYRNYEMLSGSKNFQISHLEVWVVGPPLEATSESGERSVLDTNLDAKAVLEMAGKTAYSDGLRENIEQ